MKRRCQTESVHTTRVGGNVFEDLGFVQNEAAALQAESKRRLAEKEHGAMAIFEFTLVFTIEDSGASLEELTERLGECGCTDGLVGLGWAGHIGVQFARKARTIEDARASAIADVTRAIPSARLD